MSLNDHKLIFDENKRREDMEHNIVVDEEILEISDDEKQIMSETLK